MSDNRNDLPSPSAPNFNQRLRETIQTYLGRQGNPLDRGLTLRDLIETGVLKIREGFQLKPGTGGSVPLQPGDGVVDVYEPDLTPPPTPTGFAVSAAISHVFIEHDAPLYPQGHGHLRTRVYGVTVQAGAPLPVFNDAVEITQFTGTVHAHPSNPATTWRLWIKWETVDGVLSTDPAGGTNGVEAITGQDVSKLVLAMTGPGNPFKVVTEQLTLPDGTVVPAGTYTADAFIHNGQITNAKIANLAVDNAKIANLSASKLTAGTIAVGQWIASANYISGAQGWAIWGNGNAEFSAASIRGQLTASQIDTRGLSIKDESGNVILSAGTTLDWSKVGGANKPADGATKNQIIRQANPPTGGTYSVGDLWIDTDATPTTVANWDGSQWVIIGNYTSNTNQLTDGAGLGTTALWTGVTGSGKPADGATKNQIFRQSTQPTGSSTGDLWVNTGANPVTVSQWTGSSWSSIGNYTTNTNQLVDGASLGSTAIWSYVSGSNKPADNATVGAAFGVNISGKMSDASVYINSLAVGRLLVQTFTATSTGSASMTNGATSDITINHYTGRAVLPFVAWDSPPSAIHSIVFTYADSNSFRFRMYAQSGSTGYSGTVNYAYGYF